MENSQIAAKLVKVMADCSYVAKNGINSYHNYRYATAEDVLVKVNEALTKNHLACTVKPTIISFDEVTNLKGNKEHLATVSIHIEIIDSESGESVDFYGLGSGQDAGDKAIMKAQTAAIKYAYMLGLCIATGDDPEADAKTDEGMDDKPKLIDIATEKVKDSKVQLKEGAAPVCTACGISISEKVFNYSKSRFGRPLCMDCQKRLARAA